MPRFMKDYRSDWRIGSVMNRDDSMSPWPTIRAISSQSTARRRTNIATIPARTAARSWSHRTMATTG
jgi:hypothetical protein